MALGDLVHCVTEAAVPTRDDPRPYLGLEHLAQGEPTVLGCARAADARSAKSAFVTDDLLLGRLRPKLRKAALAPFDGVCSTEILVLRARVDALPRYLLAAVHTDRFWSFAESSAVGTRMPRARWESLRRFRIALPPLQQQAEHVALLKALDHAVAANAAHLQRLREARSAIGESLTDGPRG